MSDAVLETRIYLEQDCTSAEVCPVAHGWAAFFSRRSPAKETPNEDAALITSCGEFSAVLAVADGCGGMAGGEQAARLTVEALCNSVEATDDEDTNLRSLILDGIEKANRHIRDLGTGAASTLAAVGIDREIVRPYHVGDSTILLVGNRGKIKLQTRSHAPVAYAVQAGVISEEEAIHHEDRHLVSNIVGTRDTHIEIGPRRKMSIRDTLLIASDGLFDNLWIEEIVEIIRKGRLVNVSAELARRATDRMTTTRVDYPSKPDDLTFIVFRFRQ